MDKYNPEYFETIWGFIKENRTLNQNEIIKYTLDKLFKIQYVRDEFEFSGKKVTMKKLYPENCNGYMENQLEIIGFISKAIIRIARAEIIQSNMDEQTKLDFRDKFEDYVSSYRFDILDNQQNQQQNQPQVQQ